MLPTVTISAFTSGATPFSSSRIYGKGATFDIYVNTTSVVDLYIYELRFSFNPDAINVTAMYPSAGSTDEAGFVFTDYHLWQHTIHNEKDFVTRTGTELGGYTHICVCLPLGTRVGVNTSGCLMKLTVEVVGMGKTSYLTNEIHPILYGKLLNSDIEDITPITWIDGIFMSKYHGVGERFHQRQDFYKTHPRTAKLPYNLRGEVKEYFEDGTWTAEPSGDKQKGGKRTRYINRD